jgi:predicted pyridoxine 5'-phosphate oxidase superfamily flavin-nucleotide-binding protein
MSKLYRESHRKLQREFDSVRIADRIEERLFHEFVSPTDKALIESLDMFFLATADSAGRPNCSYKGGDPGFVRVLDAKTIVFPNYDGNGMFLSVGNTLENPEVGLLFIDFTRQTRLRLNGTASIVSAQAVTPPYLGAQFLMKIAVRQVFPNCPRYIHKMQLVERSPFVPREDIEPPVPGWKRADWAVDALPQKKP